MGLSRRAQPPGTEKTLNQVTSRVHRWGQSWEPHPDTLSDTVSCCLVKVDTNSTAAELRSPLKEKGERDATVWS